MKLFKINSRKEQGPPQDEQEITAISKEQLGISNEARDHIMRLLENEGTKDRLLRVAIRGGGCSGLSLHYEFCDAVTPKDLVFTNGEARVVIDKKSLSLLGGATLHAREYLGSHEFVLVNNPIEKQCSCGKSFSL